MRSETRTIAIAAPPQAVYDYVSDLAVLPDWAIGFARSIRRDGDGWIVETAAGEEVSMRVETDPAHGVVDFVGSPAPGAEFAAPSRVLAHGDGSVYVFTVLQAPGMPDEAVDQQAEALEHELQVLKARLETRCPL
jgi:uncharacterized membrane protein